MNFYVYKITDIKTNQFYIGSRSCSMDIHSDNYMGSMVTWKPENYNRLKKEIIKDGFSTMESTLEYESKLISEYINNPLNENYYIPNKGFHTFGRKRTKEEKERISEIHSGKEITQKHRDAISRKVSGELNPMYGKTHSSDTIEKIRKKAIGRFVSETTKQKLSELHSGENHIFYGKKRTELHKPIYQYSKDGILIGEWDYIKQAAEELGISAGNISNCCSGRIKTYKGYKWRYK